MKHSYLVEHVAVCSKNKLHNVAHIQTGSFGSKELLGSLGSLKNASSESLECFDGVCLELIRPLLLQTIKDNAPSCSVLESPDRKYLLTGICRLASSRVESPEAKDEPIASKCPPPTTNQTNTHITLYSNTQSCPHPTTTNTEIHNTKIYAPFLYPQNCPQT